MSAVTVRVPASLSNIGPGFDCLGIALRLYNFVKVERRQPSAAVAKVFDEAATLFFNRAGVRRFQFSCSVIENVPRTRGLGSSATARLGLMCGLNHLAGRPVSRLTLFELCAELEGHPDNAAPACFGGFTVARPNRLQRYEVSSRLKFVVLIPEHEVKTSDARRILPAKIDRLTAVKTCGNACAVTAAFVSQEYSRLRGNFDDGFHQPFRARLIPYLQRVITAAEEAGALGAFLSGSGSSIAAPALRSTRRVADAMKGALGRKAGRTVVLAADNHGVQVTQHKA
jgi:homoserine kinase